MHCKLKKETLLPVWSHLSSPSLLGTSEEQGDGETRRAQYRHDNDNLHQIKRGDLLQFGHYLSAYYWAQRPGKRPLYTYYMGLLLSFNIH